MSKHFEIKNKNRFQPKKAETNDLPTDSGVLLAKIIKRVEPNFRYDRQTETIITIDAKTGEQVQNRPLVSFSRNFVDYWISTVNHVTFNEFTCEWKDPNSGQFLQVRTDLTIQPLPQREYRLVQYLHASSDYASKIISTFQNWFRQYANENPTLANNFFEHEDLLIDRVVQEGLRYGMKVSVSFLPVKRSHDHSLSEFKLVKQTILCNIRDNWEVKVMATLAMNLIDERKFKWSNIQDLQSWAIQKLEQIVQNHLIEARYVDLLLDFSSFEQAIRSKMETEASAIGYTIKQFLSIPQLEEFKLLEGFEFNTVTDISGNSIKPAEFVTKDPRIKIRLNVEVSGKIASLSNPQIQRYLKPGVNVVDEMRKATISVVRTFIHGIDPERFYMHYSSSYDSEKSFEEELMELIQSKLTIQFHLAEESLQISILPENTNLSTRFQKLQETPFTVTFSTFSEYVMFTARLRVIQVHETGWFRFKANNYTDTQKELNDIAEVLKDNVETYLNTELDLEFEGLNNPDFVKHIHTVVKQASLTIVDDFGLVVKVMSLKHHATGTTPSFLKTLETKEQLAQKRTEALLKLEDDKQVANINQLRQLRNELTKAIESSDEELEEEIRDKIDAIEKETWGEYSQEQDEKRRVENRKRKFDKGIEGGATFFLDSGDDKSDN